MSKPLYVFTGAYSCGKTTTLAHLAAAHGKVVHAEAHRVVLAALGERCLGHDPEAPFRRIGPAERGGHLCPLCAPHDFARLVLERQRAIEAAAGAGDFLERGWVDPVEYCLRNTARDEEFPAPAEPSLHVRYERVFLLAVMPELQAPRWGRGVAQRVAEAERISERLWRLYREAGYEPVVVPRGTVAERAAWVLGEVGRS